MHKYRLLLAILLLVPLAALAYFSSQRQGAQDEAGPDLKTLLPKIDRAAIQRIAIATPRKASITLERQGDEFRLTAPVQGRADAETVDALLTAIEGLEATGIAATKKENHARLWVDEAKAVRLTVSGAGDKPLLDLWVGKYLPADQETLLRWVGQDRVLSVHGWLYEKLERDLLEWRHKVFFNVEPDAVTAMRFVCPTGELAFVRDGEAFRVADGHKAIADLDPEQLKLRASSLARFRASNYAAEGVDAEQAGTGAAAQKRAEFDVAGDPPRHFELRFGSPAGTEKREDGTDKQMYHVQHDDDPVVYTTSEYLTNWLCPKPEDLVKKAEPAKTE